MDDTSEPEKMVSPGRALELIEHWRSLDLPRMDNKEIETALRELMNGLRSIVSSTHEVRGIRTLYRARLKRRANGQNDKDWPWRDVGALIHPIGSWVPLNRCNVEGESALYCADKIVTALREIGAGEGDEVVQIGYNVFHTRMAKVVGPFNPTPMNSKDPIFEGDELITYQIVREFIRSEFTKPVGTETRYLYRVSSSICRAWFDDTLDGWIYPSVESPASKCTALRGSSVEKHIAIKGATLARVFAVQDRCFAMQMLKKAVIHDDESIDWDRGTGTIRFACDCSPSSHMVRTPVEAGPSFDWFKARFRRFQ